MSVGHIKALHYHADSLRLELRLHRVGNLLRHRPEVLIHLSGERPQRVNLLLRHDQYMAITQWVDIEEGYRVLVFIHRMAWYFTFDNLSKNRILHGSSIREGGARAQGYPLRDIFVRQRICYNEGRPHGEVQEWLNWPLSKSGKPQGFEGSNPSLSAIVLILFICELWAGRFLL